MTTKFRPNRKVGGITNADRSINAWRGLCGYLNSKNEPFEQGAPEVIDLLTDLMHLCCEREVNFDTALSLARTHYNAEK